MEAFTITFLALFSNWKQIMSDSFLGKVPVVFRFLHQNKLQKKRLPYPLLAVVELYQPSATATFWNFTFIDPLMEDFMQATQGHETIINFSTTPQWMWNTSSVVPVPSDPDKGFMHFAIEYYVFKIRLPFKQNNSRLGL